MTHRLPAPCASNWTPSRTASARDPASGCWSPVARIRGSPATSAPVSHSTPEDGCGRPSTACISETARRGCCCPRARGCHQPTDLRTQAATSCSVASSCTGVAHIGLTGSGTQLVQPAYSGMRRSRSGSASGLTCTTSTVSRCLGRKSSRSAAHRLGGPDMQRRNIFQPFRPVDFHGGNDFRACPQHDLVLGAVGCRSGEQVAVFGPDALRVAVGDGREEQEMRRVEREPLLVNPALAQQHGLSAVEHRVHRRAPLLERGLGQRLRGHPARAARASMRARTSGRRNGGTVFGGCLRGGSEASSRVVVAVTSATAVSNASALAAVGRVTPLTLRTYWRAAASISSAVAAGSRPRSSVMFRHIRPR